MAKPSSEHVPLPDAVEQLIKNICREQKQEPPDADVRQKLALLSEEAALVILRKISACVIKKSLSAFIVYMIKKESPQGLAPVSPLHTPSPPSSHMFSPPQGLREASQKKETWSPVQRKQWPLFRGWLCAKIWVLLTSFWKVMPRWLMHYWLGNEMEAGMAIYIVEDTRVVLSYFNQWQCGHVCGDANKAAHVLAKEATKHAYH